MASPCYQCQHRSPPDCHVWCEKYKAYWEANAKARDEHIAQLPADDFGYRRMMRRQIYERKNKK